MVERVPIACEVNWQMLTVESMEIVAEGRDDFMAAADAECTAGEEVVLEICNE